MNRRTLLIGVGSLGIVSLAGCLGSGRSNGESGPGNGTETDSDADYLVQGPVGLFSAKGPWNTDLEGVVIHGYDLVAYFEEERPVKGAPEHEYEYDGVKFQFSSEEHLETFSSDPEAYVPEFGGYCSLGVGNGYKDGMHPEAFAILNGKLYFNLTPEIHEAWLWNYEERIETAEQNWPEIKDSTESIHIGPGLPGPVPE